ncbi:MAG: hypothetical protein IJ776_05910 [Paludibacteraceae bacterium]|nr:hypothetical protein [Paludibacteraceae bacterium]
MKRKVLLLVLFILPIAIFSNTTAQQQEQLAKSQAQLQESLESLGKSVQQLTQTINSYVIEISNTTKNPYKVVIDGHLLGVVNPYKSQQYLVPLEWYGRLQATQTSGYILSPTVLNFKIPQQQRKAHVKIRIQ